MPRNSSGIYTLPEAPFTPGTTISSSDVNSDFSDIAAALTDSIATDGSTTIAAPLKFPNGSAAAPAFTFANDLTTGMYYPGAQMLAFSAGGVVALVLDLTHAGTSQDGSILRFGNGAVIQPVGSVSDFAGATAAAGWLLCYGQAVSRTTYAELFTVIGTTYGSGNGVTTFNLPDLRGRAIFGKDDMGGVAANRITNAGSGITGTTLGAVGGAQNTTLVQANLPSVNFTVSGIALSDPGHTHNITISGSNSYALGGSQAFATGGISTTQNSVTGISISSQGHAASGGSSTALFLMNPAMIMNKIIFAGTP